MSKEEISPIIKAGIRIMTQVNEGLEIEVVGEMKRTEKSEHYPIGQLGVATIFRMYGMEERVFLGCQHCEDMINPRGHFLAEELVMMTFKEQTKTKMKEPNNQYGVDAQAELEKLLWEQQNESKEDFYMRIKEVLNIESFMVATDNNLDMLFKYMFSATTGIRLSNFTVAEFIKDEYGDDFYLRREQLKMEEHQR